MLFLYGSEAIHREKKKEEYIWQANFRVFQYDNTGRQKLKHYFDVSDTHEGRNPIPVPIWKMKSEYTDGVIETLESVSYLMLNRLGIETAMTDEYFAWVGHFNTRETLNALGYAARDIAAMGLREIAKTVQQLEREMNLGVWAIRRKNYLMKEKKVLYANLLTSCTLNNHLMEIQIQAEDMMENLIIKMQEQENLTEELKEKDPMQWVGLMNNIKNSAKEIVMKEIIEIKDIQPKESNELRNNMKKKDKNLER